MAIMAGVPCESCSQTDSLATPPKAGWRKCHDHQATGDGPRTPLGDSRTTQVVTSTGGRPSAAEIRALMDDGASKEVAILRAGAGSHLLVPRACEAVERREWLVALTLLNRPERLGIFMDWWQFDCLTREEFRRDLPEVWSDAEPDDTKPLYLRMWREAAKSGRVEEAPLPDGDPLTVYRGEPEKPARKTRGIAWSLDRDVAVKFALRSRRGSGVVIEGTVPRAAVLGYVTDRSEAEVILSTTDLKVKSVTAVTQADWRPRPDPL